MSDGVELAGEDLELLTAYLGERWVEELQGDYTRHAAVLRLCQTIDELSDLDFAMVLRLTRSVFLPTAMDEAAAAIVSYISGDPKDTAQVAISVLVAHAVVNAFSDNELPGHNRHQRRVDRGGCTCGWSGRDMLSHLLSVRRRQEVVALAPLDELAIEANRCLRESLRDPEWAGLYWQARSRAGDDIGLVLEHLRSLGAAVERCDDEFRVRFPGAADVELQRPAEFPVAIDAYDWTRPPGHLLAGWAGLQGLDQYGAAELCGVSVEVFDGLVAGSERITTDIAARLEAATGTLSANAWLMLERNYRAALVERAHQQSG